MEKRSPVVVSLGAGNVMIQPSERVDVAANGPQVQVDFWLHNREHAIGEHSKQEYCDKSDDWVHLACIGSNSVESLNVVIEEFTKARDLLAQYGSLASQAKERT